MCRRYRLDYRIRISVPCSYPLFHTLLRLRNESSPLPSSHSSPPPPASPSPDSLLTRAVRLHPGSHGWSGCIGGERAAPGDCRTNVRQHLVEVGLAGDGEVGPKGGLGTLSGMSLRGGRRRRRRRRAQGGAHQRRNWSPSGISLIGGRRCHERDGERGLRMKGRRRYG